jgi:micrococcal nuclease
VIKVFDGDTIAIIPINSNKKIRYEKIRFLGIDAFEHTQPPYGDPAYKYLSMLVLNKNVCIETDVDEHDKYGRTLGYVFLRDGVIEKTLKFRTTSDFMSSKNLTTKTSKYTLINEEVIKNGYAILYASEPNVRYKERLKKAVVYARTNMLGVWEKKDYILETPSEFRKKHPYKKKVKSKHNKKKVKEN